VSRQLCCIGLLSLFFAGAAPSFAAAQRAFDGDWSVVIVTQRGNCDRAYRYGISIQGGVIYYYGGAANFSGRVSRNGTIRVHVTSGAGGFANGSGRLRGNTGSGRWSGQSGNDRCSGYWTAQRH
jgi:hypothetical protein